MQGSWITLETENIPKIEIYNWFKKKYHLTESFQIWDSVKVPFLFNDEVAFAFYIERGYLDFIIYDLKKYKYFRSSLATVDGLENFNFKSYFDEIKEKVIKDEIGSLECTQKLYYYITLIDNNLSEIIVKGNYDKIKRHMEEMNNSQTDDIKKMINEIKM